MAVLKLPKEIEMDILSRLPVKSLLQFRCVSKPSRSLISDPHFVKLHLNRSILSKNSQKLFYSSFPPLSIDYESLVDNNNEKFDINVYNNAHVELDCPLLSQNSDVSVIGSCNGLICYVVDRFNVVIYNPSTRVSKELPQPPSSSSSSTSPIFIRYYYGFGFDSSDDDYKVVLGSDITDDGYKSIRFHVFSLGHNSWRRIQDLSLSHFGKLSWFASQNNGIFLNGALHWLLMPFNDSLPRAILCFELSTDEMSLDNIQCERDLGFDTLGAFEECLYGVCYSLCVTPISVEVWLMKEYGVKASWTKFITIPCDFDTIKTPLCFLRNGEVLLKMDMSLPDPHTKFGFYNTEKNKWTIICICIHSSQAALYVESLVEPNSFDGNDERLQALGQLHNQLANGTKRGRREEDGTWYKPIGEIGDEEEEEEENEEHEEGDTSPMMAQILSRLDAQMTIAQRNEEKIDALRAELEQFRVDSKEESTSLGTRLTAIEEDLRDIRHYFSIPPRHLDP